MDEFKQDAENYINLVKDFDTLQDNQYERAYVLHKRALGLYERWSTILFEVRKHEADTKTKQPALKDRIENIMKTLNNIYTSCRMVWNKSKDDLNEGKY